ncbi:MAG: hypothetical protein WBE68_16905 [Candidatus Nitrosopolaris sp.]
MEHDPKYDVVQGLISDIPSQQDILLSVNSGSGIAEEVIAKNSAKDFLGVREMKVGRFSMHRNY